MRLAVSLFVAGVVGATAAFHGGVPAVPAAPVTIGHVADLPPSVRAALGLTLADPGMPYQASDVVESGAALPAARLIRAERDGTTWRIAYEHGGRRHYYVVATLHPRAAGWTVTTARGFAPPA